MRATHRFLFLNAGINFGVLNGEPGDGKAENGNADAAAAAADAPPADDAPSTTTPTPAQLAAALADALASADMSTTTEKALRRGLEAPFGVDLSDRKAAIRAQVTAFLEGKPYAVDDGGTADKEATTSSLPPTYCRPGATGIVIGAGPAGLAAASHLQRCGVHVTVLEARARVGGRVVSDTTTVGAPADLGASIVTGTRATLDGGAGGGGRRADPASLLARQLGVGLHTLGAEMPLFDSVDGAAVPPDVDARADTLRDALLDDARDTVAELSAAEAGAASLGGELEAALARRLAARGAGGDGTADGGADAAALAPAADAGGAPTDAAAAADATTALTASDDDDDDVDAKKEAAAFAQATDADLRVVDWHFAGLEYGCSAPLHAVSLAHWNQDEEFGGFGGPHCMVVGGFGEVMARFASSIRDLRLSTPVSRVAVTETGVTVTTEAGDTVTADVCVCAVPLGVLKARSIAFDPPLPPWKEEAIASLGYGTLNKAILRFPHRFWREGVDYFGLVRPAGRATRGEAFMCWDVGRYAPASPPVLAVLFAGEAGAALEDAPDGAGATAALAALRGAFGEGAVPEPVASIETRWKNEPYSRGSYSFVAPGATGATYDALARPVGRRLLWAGEATARSHPDTVGGALLSGLREAARALGGGGALACAEEELAATRAAATAAAASDDDVGSASSGGEWSDGGAAAAVPTARGRKRKTAADAPPRKRKTPPLPPAPPPPHHCSRCRGGSPPRGA